MDLLTIALSDTSPPVLSVEGEVDVATADQLGAALAGALGTHPDLVVDLAGVSFIDAHGLRTILRCAEALNGSGPLVVVNASRARWLLQLVGLEDVATIDLRDGRLEGE